MISTPVLAFDFDNVKSYSRENKEYVITDAFGFGQELAKLKLTTPQMYNVIDRGEGVLQLVAEVEFKNHAKETNALSDMQFYNNYNLQEFERDFVYRYRTKIGTRSTPVTDCIGGKNCKPFVVEYNTEDIYSDWVRFTDVAQLPNGVVRVGIFTDVQPRDNVEWIPTWFGERLDEWAGWSSSLDTSLKSFITFNESVAGIGGSYTNIADSTHNNATTNGTTSVSGLIGNAVNLSSTKAQLNFTHPASWFNVTTNQSTVSFWTNVSKISTAGYALHWGTLADTPIVYARKNSPGSDTIAGTHGGNEFLFNGNWLGNNTWVHIALQIDVNSSGTGAAYLWINGTLVGNDTSVRLNLSTSTMEFFLFGANRPLVSLGGEYDEFGFWDRILSPDEINDLYNNGEGITFKTEDLNVNLTFPLEDTTSSEVTVINYTTTLDDACWWSNSSGVWNSSTVVAGTNFSSVHNVSSIFGINNAWTVYCNDSTAILESDTVNFNFTVIQNSQSFNATTSSSSIEAFIINITSPFSIDSAILVYNNTNFAADTIDSQPSSIFIANRQLTVPTVTIQTNISFHWEFGLGNGAFFNSTTSSQNVSTFGLSNCTSNVDLLLNYSIFDEVTQNIRPDTLVPTTKIDVTILALDGVTEVGSTSFNSSTNNTRVCLNEDLGSQSYLLDAVVQYRANVGYVNKFNHIQRFLLTNDTKPIQVPLYSLNNSFNTNFSVTFKDSNFIEAPDVLVDVSRKYIQDGVFRTVEVGKTDSNGETVLHLQENDVIYTITFKKFGEILAILDEVIVKCQDSIIGECFIRENAFSSTLDVDDFSFSNGISFTQSFDQSTKTVTTLFTSQSGTNTVLLNVTRFDRFGNTSVCSDSITSSSGTVSCVVPDSFGNSTIVSQVFSDGLLTDSRTYSLDTDNPDDTGTTVILALMAVITLSMLFISDVRGMLLGTFIGLVLASTLLYVRTGDIFSVGSSLSWALVTIVIIIWKVSQKEDR